MLHITMSMSKGLLYSILFNGFFNFVQNDKGVSFQKKTTPKKEIVFGADQDSYASFLAFFFALVSDFFSSSDSALLLALDALRRATCLASDFSASFLKRSTRPVASMN